jgi:hypothetical protein
MGFWSINSTCCICFKLPEILSLFALAKYPSKCFLTLGYNTFFTKVDFPEPLTPVTQHNVFKGNLTVISFKL